MTLKRHHYVMPGDEPRNSFIWHSGLRATCAECLNDEHGNKPPHAIRLHRDMILVERPIRNDESIPGTPTSRSKKGTKARTKSADNARNNSAKGRVAGSAPTRQRRPRAPRSGGGE